MFVSLHLRSLFRATLALFAVTAWYDATAQYSSVDLLDEVAAAYGGEQALKNIDSFEYEAVGYFIGRYQRRYTEPPYDRLPIRAFAAIEVHVCLVGASDGEPCGGSQELLFGNISSQKPLGQFFCLVHR